MKLRNKKIFSRIAAGVMVAAMAIASLPGTIKTVEAASVDSCDVNVTLLKRAEVYAPKTTFEFDVTPMTALAAKASNNNVDLTPPFADAIPDAVTASTVVFAPADSDINSKTITQQVTFSLTTTAFEGQEPGIFRYNVIQKEKGYEGITYDTREMYLDVTVGYNKNGTSTEVLGVYLKDEKGKVENIINRYGINSDPNDPKKPTDPDGKVNDLVIAKNVTGAYGEKNKDFSFTIAITGATGEKYHVVDASGHDQVIVSGGSIKVTLKHGQSVTVYGLSENDQYTITEDTYQGYNTSFATTVNDTEKTGEGYSGTGSTVSTKIATSTSLQTQKVTFTNEKDGSATGLILNYAPYALMVVLAAAVAFVFYRKKRNLDF